MEITLGPVTAIPEGEGRTFDTGRCRIAVFRGRDGSVFATQAECPHQAGPLADGLIGGCTLICPLHSWKFDLSTGKGQGGASDLKTYPVRLSSAGQVLVELAESSEAAE